MKVAQNLEVYLQKRRGNCECGNVDSYTYSYTELRQHLIKQQMQANALPDHELNEGPAYESDEAIEAANQVGLLLNHFDQIVLEGKYDIKWQNEVSNNYNNKDNVLFYSEGTRKDYGCIVKQFMWRHLWKIIVVGAVVGWVYNKIKSFLIRRAVKGISRDFYRDVKETILATKVSPFGKSVGLSQQDILRKYLQMPKMKDGLKRDEKTFLTHIWPTLNEYRQQDKEIGSIMKV